VRSSVFPLIGAGVAGGTILVSTNFLRVYFLNMVLVFIKAVPYIIESAESPNPPVKTALEVAMENYFGHIIFVGREWLITCGIIITILLLMYGWARLSENQRYEKEKKAQEWSWSKWLWG
jgi:hypothetical protein